MTEPITLSRFFKRSATPLRGRNVAALDIGTSKVACLIAENIDDGKSDDFIRVVGFGHQLSTGLSNGQVINMEATENSVRAAVDAAERMAEKEISRVIVGISANRLESHICEASVPLHGHAISDEHMVRGLRHAYEQNWREGFEILHAIPLSYGIGADSRGISDPRGMYGDELNVTLHLMSAPIGPLRNLLSCIEQCHLECEKLVVTPYASALSTLVQDEVDLGALHIDMGGGTSSATIFYQGAPIFTTVLPIGGHHITRDIARGLNVSVRVAERAKTLHGSALATVQDERDQFEVPLLGGDHQMHPKSALTKIIRPRLEETFELIKQSLEDSGLEQFAGRRVVLTGGAALLVGVPEIAQEILEKQPRIASPMRITGLPEAAASPSFAACAGLLTYAGRAHDDAALAVTSNGIMRRIGDWFRRPS